MEIGKFIKTERKKAGLTQEQLANKTGFSAVTIRQYEQGKRQPRLENIARIAESLGIPVDNLLGVKPLPQIGILGTSGMQEYFAIMDFLKSLGYDCDFSEDGCYLHDKRNDSIYCIDPGKLNELEKNVLSFAKHQLCELIEKSEIIEEKPVGTFET